MCVLLPALTPGYGYFSLHGKIQGNRKQGAKLRRRDNHAPGIRKGGGVLKRHRLIFLFSKTQRLACLFGVNKHVENLQHIFYGAGKKPCLKPGFLFFF